MDEKDFEIAAQLELLERESAINKARKGNTINREPPPGFDGCCPLCGADIPPARIAMSYYVCVDCTAENELKKKLYSN